MYRWLNHEKSKKHKEKLKSLKEILESEENIQLEGDLEAADDAIFDENPRGMSSLLSVVFDTLIASFSFFSPPRGGGGGAVALSFANKSERKRTIKGEDCSSCVSSCIPADDSARPSPDIGHSAAEPESAAAAANIATEFSEKVNFGDREEEQQEDKAEDDSSLIDHSLASPEIEELENESLPPDCSSKPMVCRVIWHILLFFPPLPPSLSLTEK